MEVLGRPPLPTVPAPGEVLGRPPLPTVPAPGEVLGGRPQSSFFFSVPALGEVLRPARPRRGSSVAIHFGRPVAIPPIHWGDNWGCPPLWRQPSSLPPGTMWDDLKQTTIRCEPIADQRSHAQHHLILRLRTQYTSKKKGVRKTHPKVDPTFLPKSPRRDPFTLHSREPTHASENGEVG